MSADHREVHVLMVTAAMQGHLNPMLRFAKRLVSNGVHVTLATTELARQRMVKHNALSSQNTTIQLEFFSDGLSLEFDREKNLELFVESLRTTASRNLSDLVSNLTKNNNFSCMIVNGFMPWWVDVAADHGIPAAMLWNQASAIYSIYYHYFKHPNLFPDLENPEGVVELPGMPLLKIEDLPSFIFPTKNACMTKLVSELVQYLDKVKWVLGVSVYELEKNIINSMASLTPILPIGPLVSPFLLGKEETIPFKVDMWNAEDYCIEWLNNQLPSSVIYVSFGSMKILSQKQIDNIAMGLKKSNKPFIWVVKPPEKGCEMKAGELPSGFLEETEGIGLVVKWCSQEKVLMHQAVACFMTHCGWNSTLETVVAGVPVIAYPEWTDQLTNAKLLTDVFKVGVRIRNGEDGVASAEEVERCIVEVIDGPGAVEIKKRAMELKEAAKKAVEDGGSSEQNFNQFIDEIARKPCHTC
ncbi:UDP-glycosyltransferase 84B2-like [Corylus avellana]|uniref:UDP-glycosyltransferase 84B2-like n=1 Tax=Corylus avellana TaxID=13451 RepID=UPI00286C4221|nr:UDP-glycosyltransferase 84B2-like [Corylus avellana]